MKQDIETRFAANLERVRGLVRLYEKNAPSKGRAEVGTTDILRAAVVLLHATFEDLLRSVLEWKLPMAPSAGLADIPLGGVKVDETPGPAKFTLQDLVEYHRGKAIEELVKLSVREWLQRSSFNNAGDLDRAIGRLSLGGTWLDSHKRAVEPLMKRRHWIVHRADRNTRTGSGQFRAQHLGSDLVSSWIDAITRLGAELLARC